METKNFLIILKYIYVSFFVVFSASCANLPAALAEEDEPLATFLVGVQHIGRKHTIPEFYIDGYSGGTLDEARTASAWICCVALSRKPNAVMIAKIRWNVIDWSRSPTGKVWTDYKNAVYLGPYHADVPIENSRESGSLYIHFFPGGKVRAVVSNYSITHPLHPVSFEDNDGGTMATVGVRIKNIFPLDSMISPDKEGE